MFNTNIEATESKNSRPEASENSISASVNVVDLLKGFSQAKSLDLSKGNVSGYELPGVSLFAPEAETVCVGDKGNRGSKSNAVDKNDNADRSKEKSEGRAEKSVEQKFSMGTTPEREHLLNAIEKSKDIPENEKKAMIKDMADFERRAARDYVSRDEVLGVYNAASRLLDAPNTKNDHVSRHDRTVLAEQVIQQAAHPMSIDQGFHETCNVTVVEARIYAKYPSKAAELVADVALGGDYKLASGQHIKIDDTSLKPDAEAKNNPVRDGDRSYASQVFQITAANIHWQQQTRDLNGDRVKMGDLRYVQGKIFNGVEGDTGERVKNFSSAEGRTISGKDGKLLDPHLGSDEIHRISNEITRKGEKDFILRSGMLQSLDATNIQTQEQLEDKLKNMGNKAPLIIQVHTGAEPFYTDSGDGKAGGSGGWHVVNVLKYDARTHEVTMSNQWGDKFDHKLTLEQLYKAMLDPEQKKK